MYNIITLTKLLCAIGNCCQKWQQESLSLPGSERIENLNHVIFLETVAMVFNGNSVLVVVVVFIQWRKVVRRDRPSCLLFLLVSCSSLSPVPLVTLFSFLWWLKKKSSSVVILSWKQMLWERWEDDQTTRLVSWMQLVHQMQLINRRIVKDSVSDSKDSEVRTKSRIEIISL